MERLPRALSREQERRAVEFLKHSFQDVDSSFKKRSEPSLSKLATLSAYVDAMHHLLAFILQIPPIDPSTALRTAFLLRLTNDVMTSVPGYPPDMADLRPLLDFLDFLDQAWLAVLNAQAWDPTSGAHDARQPGGTHASAQWLSRLDTPGEDWEVALERAGFMRELDDLFQRTFTAMGSSSEPLIDASGVRGVC